MSIFDIPLNGCTQDLRAVKFFNAQHNKMACGAKINNSKGVAPLERSHINVNTLCAHGKFLISMNLDMVMTCTTSFNHVL